MHYKKSFWKEFWLLLIITAIGLVACAIASVLAMMLKIDTVLQFHAIQWSQTIFVMILPPIFWYIFRIKGDPFKGLGLMKMNWRVAFLAVLFVICSIPAFECINYYCANIPLPESLQQIVKTMGEENARVMEQMLSLNGFFGWVELILLMSVFTAIGEEMMFRGALQKCFSFTRLNQHWQAILIGLIFSIIHFEPIGFVDRWILGTLLSYLVFWTGSLWPSIFLHATNNLVALIQYKCFEMTMPSETTEMEFGWPLVVVSFIVSGAIVLLLPKMNIVDVEESAVVIDSRT